MCSDHPNRECSSTKTNIQLFLYRMVFIVLTMTFFSALHIDGSRKEFFLDLMKASSTSKTKFAEWSNISFSFGMVFHCFYLRSHDLKTQRIGIWSENNAYCQKRMRERSGSRVSEHQKSHKKSFLFAWFRLGKADMKEFGVEYGSYFNWALIYLKETVFPRKLSFMCIARWILFRGKSRKHSSSPTQKTSQLHIDNR